MQFDRAKDHPDSGQAFREALRQVAEARALGSKAGKLRPQIGAACDALDPGLGELHKRSIGLYSRSLSASRGVIDAQARERATEAMRKTTPGTAAVIELSAAEARERENGEKMLRSQVAAELKPEAEPKAKLAAEKLSALDEAIRKEEASTGVVLALRGGSPAAQTVALLQLQELRAQAERMLPSEFECGWRALRATGDAEGAERFCYVAIPILRQTVATGISGLKLRLPQITQTGDVERELGAAHALVREMMSWQSEQVPEWLRAAKAARDLLRLAFRALCGLDVRWLSREQFARLYLGGIAGHDPDREPYRLAKPEQIVTRFLPAKLGQA
ncbi:MAG: hypothetical protein L6Q84_23535 [Polyangiaceae bacterium]|nr:hypothetical protein [Polyangiaceae bacterium]